MTDLLDDFLALEGHRRDSWPFTVLRPAIESIKNDFYDKYAYAGDAFRVEITKEKVTIWLDVWEIPESYEVSFDTFCERLEKRYENHSRHNE